MPKIMCGICGFVNFGCEPGRAEAIIRRMCRVLEHRGPDDEGVYLGKQAVLGMRRLSIIDLAGGRQPLFNEQQNLCSVINGEIYNYQDLRPGLEARGHRFATRSDSEVLVHLYEEHGEACLEQINGMFACAVWDEREQVLFLARDRLGIKPLYYWHRDQTLIFASELKALLQHPAVVRELDPQALSQYLTYEYVPAPRSIIKGIRKLPPGHWLRFQAQAGLRIRQYWDLNFRGKPELKGEQDCIDGLLEQFDRAVQRRMISDVPLGTFCSGGIDSGMIAAAMKLLHPGGVDSFHIGFQESSFDESDIAGRLAGELALNHRMQICSSWDMLELLPKLIEILYEPLGDDSVLPAYLLSRFCREHVTVALSGDGGDELFAGYPTYQAHRLAAVYDRIPGWLGKGPFEGLMKRLPVSTRNLSFDFKVKKFLAGIGEQGLRRHSLWMGSFSPAETAGLLHPDLQHTLQGFDVFAEAETMLEQARVETPFEALLYLDMKYYLQEDLLVKVDRTSMANSLEVRVPFLDHELVDFATRLPQEMKLRLFRTKYLLKKAAGQRLPARVIHRPKKGFGVPVADWIKHELRDLFCDTFAGGKIAREGLFRPEPIQQMLEDHCAGRTDNRQKLWTLFVFEKWYEQYL